MTLFQGTFRIVASRHKCGNSFIRKIDLYRLLGNVFFRKENLQLNISLKKCVSPFDDFSPKKTTHVNQCWAT
jgi:hypothetical protein